MKKLLFAFAALLLAGGMSAQDVQSKSSTTSVAKVTMEKAHVCTDACKDGKHAYACGEKGHTCSAECHKKHEMKEEKKADM